MTEELERQIEERVGALGYELVELERAGSKTRPILRIRVDVPGSAPGAGVSVDDCARVSRAVEEYLDEASDVAERYVLEVSSPGVERPLVRAADFSRFAGQEIAVKMSKALANGAKRVEGELVGLEPVDGQEHIRLRLKDGSTMDIPRADVTRANLVFRWGDRR
ncbi:MAG TPA: ribosome maturation factor RimP [Longimicrobiales bacterium]|nr:ribosome maturation factor RimP [Longimicrobiales bacterium]